MDSICSTNRQETVWHNEANMNIKQVKFCTHMLKRYTHNHTHTSYSQFIQKAADEERTVSPHSAAWCVLSAGVVCQMCELMIKKCVINSNPEVTWTGISAVKFTFTTWLKKFSKTGVSKNMTRLWWSWTSAETPGRRVYLYLWNNKVPNWQPEFELAAVYFCLS